MDSEFTQSDPFEDFERMPKRSRNDTTVTTTTKKTKASRNRSRTRVALSKSIKYHNFVRSATFGASYRVGMNPLYGWIINGVNSTSYSMSFNFSLAGVNVFVGGVASTTLPLPNYTELTALYDQYKIDWVECEFMFSNNMSNITSPTIGLPVIYLAKDYDDSNAAGVTDLQQYSTQQVWQLGNAHNRDGIKRIRIKPNVDMAVYQSALVNGYARSKPIFMDTGSPSVPHYGIKIAFDPIDNQANSNVGYLTCNFKYHLVMAHTK